MLLGGAVVVVNVLEYTIGLDTVIFPDDDVMDASDEGDHASLQPPSQNMVDELTLQYFGTDDPFEVCS